MNHPVDEKIKKVVVITGASSGIGLATAHAFVESGYRVIPCARRIDILEKEFSSIEFAEPFKLDLNDLHQVETTFSKIKLEYGAIDILINNAASLVSGKVEDIDIEDWLQSYTVNVAAVFACCKFVLPGMKKRNFGRIINISSGGSVNCSPEYSAYASSKAAINAFSKSLSKELEGTNVKVNVMSPGPCKTEMFPDNPLDPGVAIPTALMLASSSERVPNGKFLWMEQEIEIFPDLSHINWADPSSLKKN